MKLRRCIWAACLAFGLLFIAVPFAFGQSQNGQIGVGAQVPGAPPTQPATITDPANGTHFLHDIIGIKGDCTPNTTVEIYSNNIFVGSAPCQSGSTFSLQIQLIPGANALIAKQRDTLDQYSPDSGATQVFYDVTTVTPTNVAPGSSASPLTSTPASSELFRLSTDVVYRGGQTNQSVLITITLSGGTQPYALSIDWGDGMKDLVSRSELGPFGQGHVYNKPGSYTITIQGTDKTGSSAYIQTYAIVAGQPATASEQTATLGQSRLERVVNETWSIIWKTTLLFGIPFSTYNLGHHRGRKRAEKNIKNIS